MRPRRGWPVLSGSGDPDHRLRLGWVAQWATPQRVHWWQDLAIRVELRLYLLDEAPSELSPGVPVSTSPSPHVQRLRTSRLHNSWTWAPQYWWHGAADAIRGDSLDAIVVNGWAQLAFLQVMAIATRDRLPVIVYFEPSGQRSSPVLRYLRASVLRRVDGVIAAGPQAEREALRARAAKKRIARISPPAVLPSPGMFPTPWEPDPPGAAGGHRFLYVGRLVEGKNVDVLIRAFSRVHDAADELVVVGSGPRLPALRKEVRDHGLEAHVTFMGAAPHEQVAQYMRGCHTLVLPSQRESWGLVVTEGLLAGMHAVVSQGAAVCEDVADDDGVYTTAPEVEALADAMSRSRDEWSGRIKHPRQGDRGVEAASLEIVALLHRIRSTQPAGRRRAPRRAG